jgi:hypothetical protein
MNKKLLVIGGIVVVLLAVMAIVVNLSSDNKNNNSDTNKTSNNNNGSDSDNTKPSKENKKLDEQKTANLQNMLRDFVINATENQLTYPKSSSDGWLQFRLIVDNADYFADPYTGNTYKYVDNKTTPDYDEIQYAPGSTCDSAGKNFTEGNNRYVALRSRFSTGVKCISSVQIQKEESSQQ